jgi:hypothetical protein
MRSPWWPLLLGAKPHRPLPRMMNPLVTRGFIGSAIEGLW